MEAYYAVIFTSQRSDKDPAGYEEMSRQMVLLAQEQSGFIGVESVRDNNGAGITVSYWQDKAAIKSWKNQADHLIAQKTGKSDWYTYYKVRVAVVEREYQFNQL